MQFTNAREVAAFFIARAITVALLYAASAYLLSPLYEQLFRSGGIGLMTIITWGIPLLSWFVTLALFVALRGGFGGVPPLVAGQDRRNAVTSSAREIGAYFLAFVIITVGTLLTAATMARLYASLRQDGATSSVLVISLAMSAVTSVLFFLIFLGLRGGSAEGALYDDGGAPMGFGRAIATCLGKYAVFGGRASRSACWYFVLFQVLLTIALMVVDATVFRSAASVPVSLTILLLFLPGLAVTVRRLHDVDMSGWWVLLGFIPLFGLYLLVLLCDRGTKGPNRFGMGSAAIPEIFA